MPPILTTPTVRQLSPVALSLIHISVKHIDQQDVKAAVARLLPQLLDHIPLAGGHLGAGDSFLCLLHHHPPALLLGELAALDFLHGDVVVVDLPLGGHPVGQRRPRRVRRQMRLLGLEVSIVQPKLIGLGDLNGCLLYTSRCV